MYISKIFYYCPVEIFRNLIFLIKFNHDFNKIINNMDKICIYIFTKKLENIDSKYIINNG